MRAEMSPRNIHAALEAIRERDHLPVIRIASGRTSLRTPDGTLTLECKGVILRATWRRGRTIRGVVHMPWRIVSDLPKPDMDVRETDLAVRTLMASMRATMERHMSDASMDLGADDGVLDLARAAASAAAAMHHGWNKRLFLQHRSEWSRSSFEGEFVQLVDEGGEETMHGIVESAAADVTIPNAHSLVFAVKEVHRPLSFNIALNGFVETVKPMGIVEAMRMMGRTGSRTT
jgi:hypothetical protein